MITPEKVIKESMDTEKRVYRALKKNEIFCV